MGKALDKYSMILLTDRFSYNGNKLSPFDEEQDEYDFCQLTSLAKKLSDIDIGLRGRLGSPSRLNQPDLSRVDRCND